MAPPWAALGLDIDAVSGIFGSISIACWVVVFSPQIIQQFRQGNADGISIQLLIIWLLGDVFNVAGAVLQGVLPTMLILAVYYTLADMVLLGQCFYYRCLTWRDEPSSGPKPAVREPDERCALLPDEPRADWAGLSPIVTHASEDPEPQAPPRAVRAATWNAAMVAMVCAAGVLGWFLGEAATGGRRKPSGGTDSDGLELNALGQLFGYLCAVAYVASRLPQLMLNWRRKTTEGLRMLFCLRASETSRTCSPSWPTMPGAAAAPARRARQGTSTGATCSST